MNETKNSSSIYFGGHSDDTVWKPFEEIVWTEQNRAYIAAHGRTPKRGATVEELWLGQQLYFRKPIDCLLNASLPDGPTRRITRLGRLPAAEIWTFLERMYVDPSLERPFLDSPIGICPATLLVYDGDRVAHVVSVWTIWEEQLHFMDPWPARSLLCAERNCAGVAAKQSRLLRNGWQITKEEFLRVVFAVLVYAWAPG